MTATTPIVSGKPQRRPTELASYEARLSTERAWAMNESDAFFQKQGKVHETLRRVSQRLTELGIPHAVVGGLALFEHGFRRFTEDVDLLVTAVGLQQIHAALEGRGYLPPFDGSKHLRDTETKVKIEFLKTGQFPGDGLPKPIAFPDPEQVAEMIDGIPYIRLETLVELKLASGMTKPDRMKDLTDVLELIKLTGLSDTFSRRLHPFVSAKFTELWHVANPQSKRYLLLWRHTRVANPLQNFDDLIQQQPNETGQLSAMKSDGVRLDAGRSTVDHVWLVTSDPAIAAKYDMHDESEFND